jgi:hypothetical protein
VQECKLALAAEGGAHGEIFAILAAAERVRVLMKRLRR